MKRRRGAGFVLVEPVETQRRSRGLAQAGLFAACAAALLGSARAPETRPATVTPLAAAAATVAAGPARAASEAARPTIPPVAPPPVAAVPSAPGPPLLAAGAAPPEPRVPGTALRVLISISEQKAYVFRGAELVTTSPVSTGKRGHETPTGTFPISEKKVHHRSNLYSNAPMPYMQRLTASGVALHAGHVPGYPASHGCIRLPAAFARKLYAMTDYGTRVTVVRGGAGVAKKRKKSRK